MTCKINRAFSVYNASGIIKKIVHVQYIWREWSWKLQEVQPCPKEAAVLCMPGLCAQPCIALVPQGPLVYWVLQTAENRLINVIIDSKGNVLKLLFREDKIRN